ncbi:FG-GAP-like repeat-containing protein [Rubripirellula amarantea]|nr:FG-GAP-like repeat-containing protein [Rubripirellula amarantea]
MRTRFPSDLPKRRRAIVLSVVILVCQVVGCTRQSGVAELSSEIPKSEVSIASVGRESNNAKDASRQPVQSKQAKLKCASRWISKGEVDLAAASIQDLLIEDPDDPDANALMLQISMARGDTSRGIAILERMAELNPDRRDDIHAHAASLLHQNGQLDEAVERLRILLARSPQFDEARRMLARILNHQGYAAESNQQVRIFMERQPLTFGELLRLALPDRSWGNVNTDTTDPSQFESVAMIVNSASAMRINGDPASAVKLLDASPWFSVDGQVVDSQSANDQSGQTQPHPAVISLYVRSLAESQQRERLKAALASCPDSCLPYPDFWIACGVISTSTNPQVATECFARAIWLEPFNLDAYYGISQSLEAEGKPELAKRFRQRSLAIDSFQDQVRTMQSMKQPDPDAFIKVSSFLSNMGHLLDALVWQEYAIATFSPRSRKLQQIPAFKEEVLKKYAQGRDDRFILFGVEANNVALANSWLDELQRDRIVQQSDSNVPSTHAGPSDPITPPVLRNVASKCNLKFRYQNSDPPVERYFLIFEGLGGGVACLDFDRDGQLDLYFAQAATRPPQQQSQFSNGLFRQLEQKFHDVIHQSGADDRSFTFGVTAGDWNQDGFADLMIGNLGQNQLLLNQGDGTFRRHDDQQLASEDAFTCSVAIADITGDGLPEVLEINYVDDPAIYKPNEIDANGRLVSTPGPMKYRSAKDRVIVSQGDGSMLAKPLGDQDEAAYSPGLSLVVTDFDNRPGNEVFVANDLRSNQLWTRSTNSDGTNQWSDTAVTRGVAYGTSGKPMACMGVAAADFDQNGLLDLHVSNFESEWSNHYMQTKSGLFVDSAVAFKLDRLTQKMLGFGTQAIDYDNDSHWDLIVGNGHIEDMSYQGVLFAMPTQLLAGRSDGFTQVKVSGDDEYWDTRHFSRGMAKCDFDRDGLVDVVVSDLKSDAVLLHNETVANKQWLQLECIGTASERDAIGARVTITCGSQSWMQTVQTGDGYLSKNESALFFGLSDAELVDRVTVRWPSGAEQSFDGIETNRRWQITEGHHAPWLDW